MKQVDLKKIDLDMLAGYSMVMKSMIEDILSLKQAVEDQQKVIAALDNLLQVHGTDIRVLYESHPKLNVARKRARILNHGPEFNLD